MLSKSFFVSIVIVLNNLPKYLDYLLENIEIQGKNLGQYQIVIIDNISLKKTSQKLNSFLKTYKVIKIKNLQFNEIYTNILDICQGEIIIFFDGNYHPDEKWLEQLIKPFQNSQINIVAGKIFINKQDNFLIKLKNLYNKLSNKNDFSWSNFYDNQIANIAIRKDFIKQQKSLHLNTIKPQEISFYYRILREIETEITYNPSAIIYPRQKYF